MKNIRIQVRPIIFTALVVVPCAVVIVLANQVKSLRMQSRELAFRKAFPYVGQVQPAMRVATLDGDSAVIGETTPNRAQVLIFFSPSCEFCRRSAPSWKSVADSLFGDRRSVDVVWVSLGNVDSTRLWVRQHQVSGTVALMPRGKPRALYRVKAVPLTLVLDAQGQVRYVRPSVIATRATEDSIIEAARIVSRAKQQRIVSSAPALGR
jgi:methylamine dehydrogenase accessory protein MauD